MSDFITEKIKEYENEHIYGKNNDLKNDKFEILKHILFIILGIINIFFANKLVKKFPIIIGSVMLIISIILLIRDIKDKEYTRLNTMKIPKKLISIILGIIILLKKDEAILFIAIVWGLSGLRRGCKGLNVVVYNMFYKKSFVLELIHSMIEILLALVLIFNPVEKLEIHIVILGVEMIVFSLKMCFKDNLYRRIDD